MRKFAPQNTKAGLVAIVTAPANFVYSISTAHVNNNLPLIRQSLQIEPIMASWLVNIEVLVCIVTSGMTGKLCERYGSAKIYVSGLFVFAFFNTLFLIPALETSFVGTFVLRALASVGLGLFLPSTMPLSNELVIPGKLNVVVSIMSIMIPIGSILSALVAGNIAQASSWRIMFVVAGALGFVLFIVSVILLPFNQPLKKEISIDFIAVALMSVGVCTFMVGLVFIADKTVPYWACAVMIVGAICIIVAFFYYNIKVSRNPVFSPELFNKSTILTEITIFCSYTLTYMERYYEPFVYEVLKQIKPGNSGVIMAITGTGAIFFSPIANALYSKVCTKKVILFAQICYLCCELLNGFQTMFFFTVPFFAIINFCCVGWYVIMTVNATTYNFAQSPLKFSNDIGVFNEIMHNTGHSLGISLAVVVNQLVLEPEYPVVSWRSVGSVYFVSSAICVALIIISFFLGTFKFERGKKGFKESAYNRTVTFEENLIGDRELEYVGEFQIAREIESRTEKVLRLFNSGSAM